LLFDKKKTKGNAMHQDLSKKEMRLTRGFDVPQRVVFEAWTKPEHLSHWFCPDGFAIPTCNVDFRTGGIFDLCMRSPDGKDFWSKGTYLEIDAPKRIVFASAMVDDKDRPRFKVHTSVAFSEQVGKTLLTVEARVLEALDPTVMPALESMDEGWKQTLDRLDTYVVHQQKEVA
jgi:uncharacterized protein YndB with AHSA1/START domain